MILVGPSSYACDVRNLSTQIIVLRSEIIVQCETIFGTALATRLHIADSKRDWPNSFPRKESAIAPDSVNYRGRCTLSELVDVPSWPERSRWGCISFGASFFLFLVRCSWVGWRRLIKGSKESEHPTWRTYSVNAASLVAGTSRLTSMAFVFSWLLSGGSPYGMDPSAGLWKPLGPIIKWTLVASIAQQASFAPQPWFFSWA